MLYNRGMYKIHVHNLYIVKVKMILYNYTCRSLSLFMTNIVEDNSIYCNYAAMSMTIIMELQYR